MSNTFLFRHKKSSINPQAGKLFYHTYTGNGEGGGVEPPPKIFETVKNMHMPFGMQLVYDPLINLHSNNQHLISRCCHGNNGRRLPPSWIFDF